MAWWWWTLLWVVLLVAAGFFLFRVGLSLYRRARLLFTELGEASRRLTEVTEGLQTLQASLAEPDAPPAVFGDPSQMRQDRFRASRRRPSNQRVR